MNQFSDAHIYRIHAQGADAIVHLVRCVEDQLEALRRNLFAPQPVFSFVVEFSSKYWLIQKSNFRADVSLCHTPPSCGCNMLAWFFRAEKLYPGASSAAIHAPISVYSLILTGSVALSVSFKKFGCCDS
jgi:hypothetical protein